MGPTETTETPGPRAVPSGQQGRDAGRNPSAEEQTLVELFLRARGGEDRAFERLIQRLADRMIGFAFRRVRRWVEADAIAQDAAVELFRVLYDPRLRFENDRALNGFVDWLVRCQVARFYQARRRSRGSVDPIYDLLCYPDRECEETPGLEELGQCVAALPREDSDLLRRYYSDDQTLREICADLGICPGTVGWRLHRIRERLRDEMERRFPDVAERISEL